MPSTGISPPTTSTRHPNAGSISSCLPTWRGDVVTWIVPALEPRDALECGCCGGVGGAMSGAKWGQVATSASGYVQGLRKKSPFGYAADPPSLGPIR